MSIIITICLIVGMILIFLGLKMIPSERPKHKKFKSLNN